MIRDRGLGDDARMWLVWFYFGACAIGGLLVLAIVMTCTGCDESHAPRIQSDYARVQMDGANVDVNIELSRPHKCKCKDGQPCGGNCLFCRCGKD